MPDGTGGPSPAEDDLDRQLRALTEGIAGEARFRELSAAERARAAKEQARQAKKRASEARALNRRHKRRRAARKAASWTVAIVVLAGAGLLAWHRYGGSTSTGRANTAIGTVPVTNGPVPSTSTSTSTSTSGALSPIGNPYAGPPADPFAGTPAALWAAGAAGITVPAATSHGPFTASQVAAAYSATRQLLIAQDLDPVTLRGGAPTAFATLLDPKERQRFIAGLDKTGAAKDGSELSTRAWVASFAPGSATLIGKMIKVHGTMSAGEATVQGSKVLDIDVNYRFVYPVEPPRDPAGWMRVVGQVSGVIEFTNWDDPGGGPLPWVQSALPAVAGERCDVQDGFIHPDYASSAPDKVRPSGAPIDPYSLKTPRVSDACFTTTGT